jgi:excisionase family DNA binding protein
MKMEPAYFSIATAAVYSGLSEISIRRAVRSGSLKAFSVLGSTRRPTYRISKDDLDRFLTAAPVAGPVVLVPKVKQPKVKGGWKTYFAKA